MPYSHPFPETIQADLIRSMGMGIALFLHVSELKETRVSFSPYFYLCLLEVCETLPLSFMRLHNIFFHGKNQDSLKLKQKGSRSLRHAPYKPMKWLRLLSGNMTWLEEVEDIFLSTPIIKQWYKKSFWTLVQHCLLCVCTHTHRSGWVLDRVQVPVIAE